MTPQSHRLDERNHVEKPFLDQLAGLGWEILDLDKEQLPGHSHRENFAEVVMLPLLRERLQVINPWLENDQVDEIVKRLTASFPGTGPLENNRHVFDLLLENTSVSRNRQTGENSPTVRFIDFNDRDNNRFIAVCQLKVRVLGTEHHIIPDIVLFLNGLPVVVIECRSPRVKDAIPEAIDQLLRYSEQREAAVRYKPHIDTALAAAVAKLEQTNPQRLALERLKAMRTDVIISPKHNDLPHLKAYTDPSKHETSIKSFKLPFEGKDAGASGEVGILIVNNMLLTGFNAPLEQVMYLDRVVMAHNLLQAIARVNRIAGEDKNKGFVVDYVGIGHHLKASFAEALAAIFEQFRDNWQKIHEELEKLRKRISNVSRESTYGLHRKKQMPFFRMFRRELFGGDSVEAGAGRLNVVDPSPPYGWSEDRIVSFLVDLTQKVFLVIERELQLTGFWQSIPAQNRLRAEIHRTLLAPEFASVRFITENRRHLISRAMEIARNNNDIILFAK